MVGQQVEAGAALGDASKHRSKEVLPAAYRPGASGGNVSGAGAANEVMSQRQA
jgi:hypothetical protein